MENPQSKRILLLNCNSKMAENRINANINLIESELEKMKFTRNITVRSCKGWILDLWEATFTRIDKETIQDYQSFGVITINTLEEIDETSLGKIVKTSAVAKSFGI